MSTLQICTATTDDFDRILQLNDAEVQHTSAMDLERLRYLDQLAFYHRVATVDRQVAAFLFAMRDGAAYAAEYVASALATDNPRFDRAKFLAACGVQS